MFLLVADRDFYGDEEITMISSVQKSYLLNKHYVHPYIWDENLGKFRQEFSEYL